MSFGKSAFGINYGLTTTLQLRHQGPLKSGYSGTLFQSLIAQLQACLQMLLPLQMARCSLNRRLILMNWNDARLRNLDFSINQQRTTLKMNSAP